MASHRVTLVLKCVLGLLPVLYGALLIVTLPHTWLWLLVAAGVLVGLLGLSTSQDYSFQSFWPVFVGAFLLVACAIALYHGLFDQLPLIHHPIELLGMFIIAALYICWGVWATRKELNYV